MATEVGIRELLEAGVHFGHQTRRWNPKMRRFIYGERSGIYIIDLLKTQSAVLAAQEFVADIARRGGTVLFVGTKKQARDAVKEVAEDAGMPYVNHRWLGGLLTNFQTINQRIKRLHDLERYEAEGQLELLPTRERMAARADLAKLRANLGGVKHMQRPPQADVRDRPQDRGDRCARGPAAANPDHRAGRHQLRPRRDRLRDPRQRRRDEVLPRRRAGDRRRRLARTTRSSAPRRRPPAARPRSAPRARRPSGSPARRPRQPRAPLQSRQLRRRSSPPRAGATAGQPRPRSPRPSSSAGARRRTRTCPRAPTTPSPRLPPTT